MKKIFCFLLIIFSLLSACNEKEIILPPAPETINQEKNTDPNTVDPTTEKILEVITVDAFDISSFSAMTAGEIKNETSTVIIERGIVWATNPNPTLDDNVFVDDGLGNGVYTFEFECLNVDTEYFVRAYAKSSNDSFYGNQVSFNTLIHKVYSGDVQLTTQEEVNEFAKNKYSKIDGYLAISGNNNLISTNPLKGLSQITDGLGIAGKNISDFSGLQCLKSIDGVLYLNDVDEISSLSQLEYVGGDLRFINCNLTDLSTFDNLKFIGGSFRFIGSGSSNLSNLEGFHNVTSLGSNGTSFIEILGNPKLFSVNLFNGLSGTIDTISLMQNGGAISLDGFGLINKVGYFRIEDNSSTFFNIDGFKNLETIDILIISDNAFTAFNGLNEVKNLKTLRISNTNTTPNLKFNGLQSVVSIGDVNNQSNDAVRISAYNLVELNGLATLENVIGNFVIGFSQISTSLDLPNLNFVDGNLIIYNVDYRDLNFLKSLSSVTGILQIVENEKLLNLNGLENLTSVGRLLIKENPNLINYCALQALMATGFTNYGAFVNNGYNILPTEILEGNCKP